MPFLDDLIGVHDLTVNGGSALPRRSVLNVVGTGVTAVDNPTAGTTDLTLPASVGELTITPTPLSASVNDYSPTGHATASVERWSSGVTARNVTGLDAAALPRPVVANVGSATITLKHESASSAAANRFLCPGGVDYLLGAGNTVELVRDSVSARWRIVS